MSDRIVLGISACLLGKNVRYDGNHKLDPYLYNTLGRFAEWIPVCPETECGLSTPRDPMHLIGDPEQPHLVTKSTGMDFTKQMQKWMQLKFTELEKFDLLAFVFKSKSPSCGINGIKIFTRTSINNQETSGLFAKAFMQHFPRIPIEDDDRLHDPLLLKNFIEKIFIYKFAGAFNTKSAEI